MFNTLQNYIFKQFIGTFLACLLVFSSLFLIFEFFERVDNFIKEGATIVQIISYILYKIPFILQVMSPVAVLLSVLISIGKLSQLSEITAMRACGSSLFSIIKPLLVGGAFIWGVVFLGGETLVPWASERLQTLYQIDIKKKVESGAYSRSNFWFRDGNEFFNIGVYDSRFNILNNVSVFKVNRNFELEKRTEANLARWGGEKIGWAMEGITESLIDQQGNSAQSHLKKAPLLISEAPEDFYNFKRKPESMSYRGLTAYAKKLSSEGVPVTRYLVDLAAKISFPLVNFIIVLTAFPFALSPARSGNMTKSLVAGLALGFGYHVIHALFCSLGAAGLLPVTLSAWTANIIYLLLGAFLLIGAEFS